ncbi:hypothetical protein BGZ57DRAFT_211779 [Hyaloscypha finlandica]|nr:hypothetical protein BGZ57DRAFT_211779 [Hyaloscypha finlandica]
MESKIWDTNETRKRQNRVSFGHPDQNTQSDSSSQWSFTPVSTQIAWPQSYTRVPLPVASKALPGMPFDESWNCFDGLDTSFGNSTMWDQWDGNREFGNNQTGVLNAQCPVNVPVPTVFQQTAMMPGLSSSNQALDFDGAFAGQLPLPVRPATRCGRIKNTSRTPVHEPHSPIWNAGASSQSGEFKHQYQRTDSSASWNTRESSYDGGFPPSGGPVPCFEVGPGAKTLQSRLTKPVLFPLLAVQRGAKAARKATSMSLSSGSTLGPQKESHKGTEKKYRGKLNDGFTNLFKALPKEYVGAEIGGEIGSGASKVETLQLAISHIEMLERQQKELEQESLVLRGQVGLFERLINPPTR